MPVYAQEGQSLWRLVVKDAFHPQKPHVALGSLEITPDKLLVIKQLATSLDLEVCVYIRARLHHTFIHGQTLP